MHLLLVSIQSVYQSSFLHPKPLFTLCSHPFNLGLSPQGLRVTAAGVPPALPAGPAPSPWDAWHSEGKRAVGKGSGGEACQGRATQHSISAGDQDSRAKLRAGDLSKRESVVWAAGSGITAQQEFLFFCFFK